MNRKYVLLALLAFVGSCSFAQKTAEVHKLEGAVITGVVVDDLFDIEIRQGDSCGVELSVDDRLAPYLKCELSQDGCLRLGYTKVPSLRWKGSADPDENERKYVAEGNVDPRGGRMYRKGHATVTVNALRCLVVKAGGSVCSRENLTADSCRIELRQQPGRFRLNLSARYLELNALHVKGLLLSGTADVLKVDLGHSKIALPELNVGKISGKITYSTFRAAAPLTNDLVCTYSRYERLR